MPAFLKKWLPWMLVVIFFGAAVTFGLLWFQSESDGNKVGEVEAAATDFVTALTNFSADTIDTDTAEIKSYGIGDFLAEAETFFGDDAVAAIEQADASVSGEIKSLFVQDINGSEASVFAVSELSITNSQIDEPRRDLIRLDIGMIESADGWKVDRVAVIEPPGEEAVPSPGS